MQCVILAGGFGTRIRERSGDKPKALIPVLGTPFVFYQLRWLAGQNVDNVVLCVGHRSELIEEAVGDGSQFGVSVAYSREGDDLRGTGGALRLAADQNLLQPGFFVLYGDSYLTIDVAPLWRASDDGRACTMAVIRNAGKWDKSNVLFRDGMVALHDKTVADSAAAGMDCVDYGVSVLTREAIVENIAGGAVADLADLTKTLSREGRLRGYEVFERFYEIGSPGGLDELEAYLRGRAGSRA